MRPNIQYSRLPDGHGTGHAIGVLELKAGITL